MSVCHWRTQGITSARPQHQGLKTVVAVSWGFGAVLGMR
jgi:hypothetical protein